MVMVVGVDGCPHGWLCLRLDTETGALTHTVHASAQALLTEEPRPAAMAIDMPIGLPAAGSRACDLEARKLLSGPRKSSVFPAPIRPAIHAPTHDLASEITHQVDGRRVSAQAYGLFHKIGRLDARLTPEHQAWVHEVHPEVSFWAWNGGLPLLDGKKTRPGRAERRALIDAHFGRDARKAVRDAYLVRAVSHDDIHDAFAALWTSRRLLAGTARRVPTTPAPLDDTGLRMEIWY